MARSLQNPNVRRRINKVARAVRTGEVSSVEEGVAIWLANRDQAVNKRPIWMRRVAGEKAGQSGSPAAQKPSKGQWNAQNTMIHMTGQGPEKVGPSHRKALERLKAEVAHTFEDAEGYGDGFAARALAGKGRSYHKGAPSWKSARGTGKVTTFAKRYPKTKAGATRKLPWGGALFLKKGKSKTYGAAIKRAEKAGHTVELAKNGRPFIRTKTGYRVGRVEKGILAWDAKRQAHRKANQTGHTYPKKMAAWLQTHGSVWSEPSIRKVPYAKRTISKWTGSKAKKAAVAKANALALDNPQLDGVGSYLTGYALPVVAAGAAGGALHAFLNFGPGQLSSKLNGLVENVPVAGPWITATIPNTFAGLIAGGALALIAARTGGDVRKYLALAGGATLAIGGGMDAYNLLAARMASMGAGGSANGLNDVDMQSEEELLGALALDNFGGIALDNMGALALDNMGAIALDNFGDGMAYETAPLAGEQIYGQATLGDAYYSGADFSLGEGQALLNGSQVWVAKFGRPARRTTRIEGSASHLAGARGHRWGWLIKLVGFRRAGAIAAMKPKQRLRVVKALRAGAIKGFQQATQQQRARAVQAATPSVEEFAATQSHAGSAPIAPQGACGPAGPGEMELAYGDPALFMS